MDCRTARHLLNCFDDGLSGGENPPAGTGSSSGLFSQEDLANHLERCSACRQLADEIRDFDRRMSSLFPAIPIPAGLEDRLLEAVDQEFTSRRLPQESPPASPRKRRSWKIMAVTTALVMLSLGVVWWMQPSSDELLNYHGAGQLLVERFLKPTSAWEELDPFDGNFDLGSSQTDLGLFQLSSPHGIDLGGGRSQDAAVFEFGLKSWKGIITVLPSQHFTGLPDMGSSNVRAGRSVLQWRSSDGKLTYLCFVHRGSAAELALELFGLLT